MPRKAQERADSIEHVADRRALRVEAGAGKVGIETLAAEAPDRRGERADRILRQPERLADFADRRAAAITDDGRGNSGALAPVTSVDVLDHFLASLVLEIDVDVRRLASFGGNEAFEQKIGALGIDLGDAEAEAHRRIRRRAAALAQDV